MPLVFWKKDTIKKKAVSEFQKRLSFCEPLVGFERPRDYKSRALAN